MPAPLSVEAAVQLAIARNPRLTAVVREIAAAQAGVRSARSLANPTFLFVPALTSAGASDEEILLSQPLELNGVRRARTDVARGQLRQSQAQAVVELRNLVQETKSAYFELARAQELLTVARDILRTAEEFDRGVRRQAEEGLRPGIDPVQTGIEAARARQQLTLAESQVRIAQAALNTLTGHPVTEPVAAATPLVFTPTPVDAEALVTQALEARAELQAEQAVQAQFRGQARIARAEGRPDLAPQFRAESVTRGGGATPGIGLGITLPFLDHGSRRNRIRQAEQEALAQEARIESTRNRIRQEVVQAVARLQAAEAVVRNYQGGVLEQSRRLLDASLRALQIGAPGASLLNVLESQRTYRGVLTDYNQALAQHAQARAELERATGAVSADLLPSLASAAGAAERTRKP